MGVPAGQVAVAIPATAMMRARASKPLSNPRHTALADRASASLLPGVTCPPNAKGGDAVQIQDASGQFLTVVVPPGVQPGQQFDAQVPAGPPVVQAQAVPM